MMYSTRQVADMLGLSEQRVRQAAPKIANKIGSCYVWTDEDIERLKARKGKAGNPNWVKKEKEQ